MYSSVVKYTQLKNIGNREVFITSRERNNYHGKHKRTDSSC